MREWEFALVVEGDLEDEASVNRLFEAGCDDATLSSVDGVGYAEFTREAGTFSAAVLSAISDVEGAGFRVLHIEPDDLVTQSEIAGRLDKSREYVRLLAAGRRGPGGFPPPVSHARDRGRLWRWADVAAWAHAVPEDEVDRMRFIAAANGLLEAKRQAAAIGDDSLRKDLLDLSSQVHA